MNIPNSIDKGEIKNDDDDENENYKKIKFKYV
jgi:hypothetical protein